ncbi:MULTISPECIES: HPr family phosphocarrier protein [Euryhalocaulis]|uniref:HPr family phosphocarrier protein n=1 Tax=Euryhalocaulis TaxID=1712422 RepID=UPI0003A3BB81|nr:MULTISPECIES: HPr family phosphocarrier protein [Euryhalocaulis]MBA4801591.1 HPr family phosphocarrier protein [Euryhalocaulis sp.]
MAEASQRVQVTNVRGLHARASAKFVQLAAEFQSSVHVRRGGETAPADSIMELLMLQAGPGAEIEISADGPDAPDAVKVLAALVEARFGEDR